MKYNVHASKAGDKALIITGGPAPLVIHVAEGMPLEDLQKLRHRLADIFKELSAAHPLSGSGWYPKGTDFRNMLGWLSYDNATGVFTLQGAIAPGYTYMFAGLPQFELEYERLTRQQYIEIFGLSPQGNECQD